MHNPLKPFQGHTIACEKRGYQVKKYLMIKYLYFTRMTAVIAFPPQLGMTM